ncbi:MAG TPA: DUF3616 domain-containing protein [Pyrinomonadaceae bacterium]|jgi:hypothetical protein
MNYINLLLTISFCICLLAVSCSTNPARSEVATNEQTSSIAATPTPPSQHLPAECAASASVRLGADMFLVGSDEDNILRMYAASDFKFIKDFPLGPTFKLPDDKIPTIKDKPKTDLEGAAWLSDAVFWVGSHSTSNEGEEKPDRKRIFAHEIKYTEQGLSLVRIGQPYANLVQDLNNDPQYKNYNLPEAAKKKAKEEGGLSIEGLAAGKNNSLLIGFRNPVVKGKALIATLVNPREVLENTTAKPKFDKPIELDLGGYGIRDITRSNERNSYLIIAGPFSAEKATFRLYEWNGDAGNNPKEIQTDQLKDLNPEAIIVFPPLNPNSSNRLLILNDDEKDPKCAANGFRSVWIDLPN